MKRDGFLFVMALLAPFSSYASITSANDGGTAAWLSEHEEIRIRNCVYVDPTPVFASKSSSSYLSIGDIRCRRESKVVMPVELVNEDDITALQMDLVLPEGVSLFAYSLTDRKSNDHVLSVSMHNNGTYRLTVFSLSNTPFSGNEGTLMNLTLDIGMEASLGDHTITIKNVELSTTTAPMAPDDCTAVCQIVEVIDGDVYCDGRVSILDVTLILDFILGGVSRTFDALAADVDRDGVITIFDAMLTLNIILDFDGTGDIAEEPQ